MTFLHRSFARCHELVLIEYLSEFVLGWCLLEGGYVRKYNFCIFRITLFKILIIIIIMYLRKKQFSKYLLRVKRGK